jgi:hypothetical protein
MRAAVTAEDCWNETWRLAEDLGFRHVELKLGGEIFRRPAAVSSPSDGAWTMHIALSESDYIRLMCDYETATRPVLLTSVADLFHRVLAARSAEFGCAGAPEVRAAPLVRGAAYGQEESFNGSILSRS